MTPAISTSDSAAPPRWFALYLRSRYEKRAQQLLVDKGIESFLPLVEEVHEWSDRRKRVHEPLFRGYLFVRSDLKNKLDILKTDGVVDFVGSGTKPDAIPDEQINWVRILVRHPDRIHREMYLVQGKRVAVAAGPFHGLEGFIVKTKSALRVVVCLDSIAQAVSVEVDADIVEPIRAIGREAVSASSRV